MQTSHTRHAPINPPSRREVLLGGGAIALAAASAGARAHQPEGKPQPATTPAAAAQQGAGFYRFMVGSIECFAIGDAGMPGQGSAYPTFGVNATQKEVDALTEANFIPPSGGYSYFNVLLLRSGREVTLVDTGFGTLAGPAGGWLTRTMGTLGVMPADVTSIIFSHLHPDHFGGYTLQDGTRRFPSAKVFLHEREHAFWSGDAPDLSKNGVDATMRTQMVGGAKSTLKAIGDALTLTKQGSEVHSGVTIEEAFGHTPGHQMVRVASGNDQMLMMADLTHHFAISFQRPQWHVAYDTDPAVGATTRRSTLERLASERTLVMGYHTPWPGLGHVRKIGDAFEWTPSAWRW
jgi:glyoxylase-like metal-dependent hydrolase (beta-lactamase superfamily II)